MLSAPIFRLKRQAKLLSRETNAPLHACLDAIARQEGFQGWSHLAGSWLQDRSAPSLLDQFVPGDLVLLAARPGHGKTIQGLELCVAAIRQGGRSYVFSLEETGASIQEHLRDLGMEADAHAPGLVIDTSDAICADYIISQAGPAPGPSVILVDYLQLLDQKRDNPELSAQVKALAEFAQATNAIVVLISQIDRSFEAAGRALPDLSDVRLPNPIDLTLFTKACFLHQGEMLVRSIA